MALTVKIEDKAKKQAAAAGPPPDLADFVMPGERGEGTKAFIGWVVLMIIVSIVPMANENTRGVGIGILAWWLLSVLGYYVLAPRSLLRRLRLHGAEFSISARKQPRLHTLLSKGSAMLGVQEPEGFLVDEGVLQVRIVGRKNPYFMIISKAACEGLQPPELDCLALRALVHARQNHVSRLMLLQFLNDTPAALRLLVWPVSLYGTFLRAVWFDLAEQTADRLTLLLVKNPKLLMGSILKLFAATDPIMQENKITAEDVDSYIRQGGLIGTSGSEISTQYKIGNAIQTNPFLEERVQSITTWVNSPEYVAALEKLASTRAGKSPTAVQEVKTG